MSEVAEAGPPAQPPAQTGTGTPTASPGAVPTGMPATAAPPVLDYVGTQIVITVDNQQVTLHHEHNGHLGLACPPGTDYDLVARFCADQLRGAAAAIQGAAETRQWSVSLPTPVSADVAPLPAPATPAETVAAPATPGASPSHVTPAG